MKAILPLGTETCGGGVGEAGLGVTSEVTVGEAVDGVGDAIDDGVPVAAGFSSPSPQATTGNRISTSNTTAIVLKGEVSLLRNAQSFLPSITHSTPKGHSLAALRGED
jgi:hypothetical protein